jgi:hypothetical protein
MSAVFAMDMLYRGTQSASLVLPSAETDSSDQPKSAMITTQFLEMVVPVSVEKRTTTLAVENPVCATRLSTSKLATPRWRRTAVTPSRSLQKLSTSLWTRLVRTSSSSTTESPSPIKCRTVSSSRFMPNIPETSSARTFCYTSLLVTCSTSPTVPQFLLFITATKNAKPNKTSNQCCREWRSPVTSCC